MISYTIYSSCLSTVVINYFPKFLPEELVLSSGKGPFEKGWKRICAARLCSFLSIFMFGVFGRLMTVSVVSLLML